LYKVDDAMYKECMALENMTVPHLLYIMYQPHLPHS
jgi:hypothetical protein